MKSIQLSYIKLHVSDEGAGPLLLLVHGFPLSHAMWQGQIDSLKQHCRVITPDLRGFGQSGVTEGTVTMEQFADDLSALLDAMNITEPVTYCGLSMGGYIGWQFWRKYRSRVRSLILCDTKAAPDTPEAAKGRLATAEKVLKDGAVVVAEAMLPKLFGKATHAEQPHVIETTKQTMLNTNPQGIAAALRGMAERIDARPLLATIDVPTLLIVGAEDAITPPDEMRSVADAIAGSKFVNVAAAGHMAPLEKPAEVNAAIEQFMTR